MRYARDSGNTGLQQATAGNSATVIQGEMLETLATLDYNGQLLATQQHTVGGALETLGYNRQMLATQQYTGGVLETLATLGYNRQLLATQQQTGGSAGDTGNPGLQQATAGNSATDHGRRECWRHYRATLGYNRQLSNTQEG